MQQLIVEERLFTRLRQLILALAFPSIADPPPTLTPSLSSSSTSVAPSSLPSRPLPFIHAILFTTVRIVDICSVQTSTLIEAIFLFAAHLLTIPTLLQLFNSSTQSIFRQSLFQSRLRSSLILTIAPDLGETLEESKLLKNDISPIRWHRLQVALPEWIKTDLDNFDKSELLFNLPPHTCLFHNLIDSLTFHPFSAFSSADEICAWSHLMTRFLRHLPREIFYLTQVGRWSFDHLDQPDEGRQSFTRRWGQPIQHAVATSVRCALLNQLAVVFSQKLIIECTNSIFRYGWLSQQQAKEDDSVSASSSASSSSRADFESRLKSFALLDAPPSEVTYFDRLFDECRDRHRMLVDGLLALLHEFFRLRSSTEAFQVYHHTSPLLTYLNSLTWISFSSPILRCIWSELTHRMGCPLNEKPNQDFAYDYDGDANSNGGKVGKLKTVSLIKAFFGFTNASSPTSSSTKQSSNHSLQLSNRNRWEAAILTSRHMDNDSHRSTSIMTVTDLFFLWISAFLPLLFVLDDDELLDKLPGFPVIDPTRMSHQSNRVELHAGRRLLVSFVHLLKMIVFRLIWNKYEPSSYSSSSSSVRVPFRVYSNLLEPCRRILKELYQRDSRRRFMMTPKEEEELQAKEAELMKERQKQSKAIESTKSKSPSNSYQPLPIAMDTFSSTSHPPSSAASSLPFDDSSIGIETQSGAWLLTASNEGISQAELNSFEHEFEAWSTGKTYNDDEVVSSSSSSSQSQARLFHILSDLPFILTFQRRVSLLRSWIRADSYQFGYRPSGMQQVMPMYEITIRRSRVVADGLYAIERLGRNFKHRMRVKFVDDHGVEERGIDLGGLTKELIEEILKEVFRTDYGLFTRTAQQEGGLYYPNPGATVIHPDTYHEMLKTLGRLVGKALYENILLDVPFAPFFLNKFIDQSNVLADLKYMDAELYKNVIYVKNYPGDVRDLGLVFTVDTDVMGQQQSIELIANGAEIEVNNSNKILYVYKLAHYHLTVKIAPVVDPFMDGLQEIIQLRWFRLFNISEMRQLLSGSTTHAIAISDWKQHTQYEECSASTSVCVWFWEILEHQFTPAERSLVLKFATSCSRPPLQGFKELYPPFTLRVIPVIDSSSSSSSASKGFFKRLFSSSQPDTSQLPSAATCFNTLKLPKYSSKSVLESKLRIAIQHHSGFHLT